MRSDGPQVLIVEDDEDVRTMLQLALTSHGYRAAGVRNGNEALAFLATHLRPALAIVDLMMPDMSGEDLVRRVKTDDALAELPIVLFSGHSMLPRMAETLHVAGYLSKPVDLDRLLGMVARHAGRSGGEPERPFTPE